MRRSARAFWRTALAALVMLGICTWKLVLVGTGTASAQDSSTSTTSSTPAVQDSSWVPGNATATSQAFTVGPGQGGLSYAFTFGFSVADFEGSEGYAESKTFDGGALIDALEVQECPGSSPYLVQSPSNQPNDVQDKDYLPNPVVVEAPTASGGNDSFSMTLSSSYDEGTSTPGPSAGLEDATATLQPSGSAISKIADFGLPGVFDISGAQSSASAQQIPGQLREATSTADISEVSLGGEVDLKGLHWQDTQETGPGGAIVTQSASFSLGELTVAGTDIPIASDDVSQLTDIINAALAGEGIQVTIPTTVTQPSGEEDLGPMTIGIANSSLLAQALGPTWTQVNNGVGGLPGYGTAVNDLQQDENPFTGQPLIDMGNPTTDAEIASELCQLNTPTAVASILAAVLTGGGTLGLNLGGATALSQGIAYANPFGSVGSGSGSGSGDNGVSLGSSASPTSAAGSFLPGTPGIPGTAGMPGSFDSSVGNGSGGAPKKLALGRTSERCTASCGGGNALPVGLAGLSAVAGTGIVDYTRVRRHRLVGPLTIESP